MDDSENHMLLGNCPICGGYHPGGKCEPVSDDPRDDQAYDESDGDVCDDCDEPLEDCQCDDD